MAVSFFTLKNFMKMSGIHPVLAISSYQKQLDQLQQLKRKGI